MLAYAKMCRLERASPLPDTLFTWTPQERAAIKSVSDAAGYVRPTFITRAEPGAQVWIDEGRHAILDAMLESGAVPNGAALDTAAQKAAVITGPNMGGKSVYVKSVALAVVMAQCGVYVPAKALRMTPLDAIWTRMGAEDSLARGQSTFQVELGEASVMLRAATPRTLLILDELGRGTSTHDGVAIAIVAGRPVTVTRWRTRIVAAAAGTIRRRAAIPTPPQLLSPAFQAH